MYSYLFLIFFGGSLGACLREILITISPEFLDGFPLGIFLSNIIASFCLGVVSVLYKRKRISEFSNVFVATGIMGGLSTFSSFIYGSVEMMGSSATLITAFIYIIVTVVFGYLFLHLGQLFGNNIGRGMSSCDYNK